ncbi:hypothetical protein GXW78_04190 [Roseomonas terrae]|jgi:hypothetical protein|uniref:DUF4239 domain-containing protein n=1 Tax=Neoroseomonas terrae TaxID=424799 RepID=A0ABS5ECV3_9PROT|nr:hypothetical protein [Neoroseomonas terrae]MBR0648848.1 hypothetical protein [Neoroseomonas terrae]
MLNDVIIHLAAQGVGYFALLLVAIQLVAKEAGYFVGFRIAQRQESLGDGVGVVVGGMLGLLAFVLALTLSFSSGRYQERRNDMLAEANAIGTAWLQAGAIGDPRGAEIARLLESYAQQRRDFMRADLGSPLVAETTAQTNALQSAIWGHVAAIVREQPGPAAVSLMNAVNATFDMSTASRFAFSTTLPPQLFWLLVGMTAISMAALGFQLGLRQRPLRLLSLLLLGMWTVTTVVILDLGSARLGSVRIGTDALDWTIQGFAGGITIPPPPAR